MIKTHNKFTKHSSPGKIILSKDTSSKLELCQTVTAQDLDRESPENLIVKLLELRNSGKFQDKKSAHKKIHFLTYI